MIIHLSVIRLHDGRATCVTARPLLSGAHHLASTVSLRLNPITWQALPGRAALLACPASGCSASNETNKNYNLIIVPSESCYLFNCFNCDLGLFSLDLFVWTCDRYKSCFGAQALNVYTKFYFQVLGLFVIIYRF